MKFLLLITVIGLLGFAQTKPHPSSEKINFNRLKPNTSNSEIIEQLVGWISKTNLQLTKMSGQLSELNNHEHHYNFGYYGILEGLAQWINKTDEFLATINLDITVLNNNDMKQDAELSMISSNLSTIMNHEIIQDNKIKTNQKKFDTHVNEISNMIGHIGQYLLDGMGDY